MCLRVAKISEFSPKYFHIFGSLSTRVHRIPRFNMLSLIYHMCCLYKYYTGVSRRLVINHAKHILQNETGYCRKDNPLLIYLLVLTLRWFIYILHYITFTTYISHTHTYIYIKKKCGFTIANYVGKKAIVDNNCLLYIYIYILKRNPRYNFNWGSIEKRSELFQIFTLSICT